MELLTEIKFNLPFFKEDKKIHSLFEKHDLFPTIEEINLHLEMHLKEISISGKEMPLTLFGHITSYSLVAINNKIHIIKDPLEKRTVQLAVAKEGYRIYLFIISVYPYRADEITKTIINALEETHVNDA